MRSWLRSRLHRSEKGATAVEYGLMIALIAAVIIVAVVALGNNTSSNLQCTANSIGSRSAQC
ncbi:MAG: Flp family type IVb pilin [Actinomycetota bacterium]